MTDDDLSYGIGGRQQQGPGEPFPAQVTAVTAGSGNYAGFWVYDFAEQIWNPTTSAYTAMTAGRVGNYSTTGFNLCLEVNNQYLPKLPFYAWLRLRGVIGGSNAYEFDGPLTAGGAITGELVYTPVNVTALTGNTNNLALGFGNSFNISANANGYNLTGIDTSAMSSGTTFTLNFTGSHTINLTNLDAGSSSANRFNFPSAQTVTYAPGQSLSLTWNGTNLAPAASTNFGISAGSATIGSGSTFSIASGGSETVQSGGTLTIASGASIIAAAGSTVTGFGGSGGLAWTKITKTFADFSAAATTNTLTVYTFPARGYLHALAMKHSASFTGGAIASYTIQAFEVSTNAGSSPLTGTLDVFQAPAYNHSTKAGDNELNTFIFDVGHVVQLTATSGGANLNAAAAGSVDLWLLVSALP